MALDARLLDVLVCPQCKGALQADEGESVLVCRRCQLKYPVREGIPVMLPADAIDLRSGKSAATTHSVKLPRVTFRVIEGADAQLAFTLEQGTCRAIGRATVDPNKTAVFNVDIALALDEGTRSLILKYIGRQFQKSAGEAASRGDLLGTFRRISDVVLSDASLSRLHAMVFSDGEQVAILDLVSKNGTYVNGVEIESMMLSSGDIIEIGDTKLIFER